MNLNKKRRNFLAIVFDKSVYALKFASFRIDAKQQKKRTKKLFDIFGSMKIHANTFQIKAFVVFFSTLYSLDSYTRRDEV